MRMKKSKVFPVMTVLIVLIALVTCLMISTVITSAAETVTTFADNTFEGLTVGANIRNDGTSFYMTPPSLATAIDDHGNRVIRFPLRAAAEAGSAREAYVVYGGKAYTVSDSRVTIDGVSYPVTDGRVSVGGEEYVTSTDALAYELCFGGGNVNQNITVKNSEISYKTADKIYLQAEYYISEDAKGTAISQFRYFSYEETSGNRVEKSWYPLFSLLLDNGDFRTDLSRKKISGVLDKGAWNTVTVVIDTDHGDRDFYVNNRHVCSDMPTESSPYRNLILNQNNWIVAKINRGYTDPWQLAGFLYIDDAKAASLSGSDIYNNPVTNGKGGYLYSREITTSTGRKLVCEDDGSLTPIFCGAGASVTPKYYDFSAYEKIVSPVDGASMRLNRGAGIRFATQLNTDLLNRLLTLKKNDVIRDVSIGTLISPTSYVRRAGAFTVDALNALGGDQVKFVDVKGRIGEYDPRLSASELTEGYDASFVGSLTNVKLDNRSSDFSGVGYVKITLKNGSDVYFYSYEYDADRIGAYSASVQGLAELALNQSGVGYTESQRAILESLRDGATVMELDSSALRSVRYTATELFFRNAAGVYCRLTYEGVNGWRLQATATGYNGFDETGAGQALGIYLGEMPKNRSARLTVTEETNRIRVAAEGTGSYVELNTGFLFGISFYTEDDKLTSRLTSIETTDDATTTADGTVTLRGALGVNEGIYGGGERFDMVNQRGNAFRLYTMDGWNRADTTYVAIPLFVTTRGAGMFVNRYENMAVDFGKTKAEEWSITINNDLMDCYFYATGKMSDALLGYTELSGHSSLPGEWAQGVIVCRYSPDLSSFEDRTEFTTGYASHEEIPEYGQYGVYAIGYANYTEIPGYGNYYVKSKSDASAFALISEVSDTDAYDFERLYADAEGTGVAYGKSGSKYFPLGKNWATLAEADAFGTDAYDMKLLYKLNLSGSNVTGINSSKKNTYALCADGMYYKTGSKGNPAGHGVKTIVENLIRAGMTPTAVLMEPWNWRNISTNEASKAELKKTVEWLDSKGIKAMLYMGVGAISSPMKGYREEYQVWATMTYPDGRVARTYAIPKTSGTGENPDVGSSATQSYIDITNPEAMDWYLNEIWGMLLDIGIDGIKIDFCETMPDEGRYTDANGNLKFIFDYDWYDDTVFDGDDVHHAYSTYFISLFYKSMLEQKAEKKIPDGFVVLSRGGGIGSQRNPYLWEGDQGRTFEKIEDQLIALINSGISAIPFMTYDMAGYAYQSGTQFTGNDANSLETESEVFARAIEFSAFTSNIQTHGDVRHAYQMTEETQEIYRRFTQIHDQLMPYIQKYSQVAVDTGLPVVRAMVLEYQNDVNVYGLETQYMFGEALLVAPILKGSEASRSVYLPAGNWLNLLTGETVTGRQTVTVNATLGQLPVFMRMDCSKEDRDLLADVFHSETWKKINGGISLTLDAIG